MVSKPWSHEPATPKNASAALQGRRFRLGRLEHQCVAQPHAKTARAQLDDLVGVVSFPGSAQRLEIFSASCSVMIRSNSRSGESLKSSSGDMVPPPVG